MQSLQQKIEKKTEARKQTRLEILSRPKGPQRLQRNTKYSQYIAGARMEKGKGKDNAAKNEEALHFLVIILSFLCSYIQE